MGAFRVSTSGGTIITRQGRAVSPGQEVTSEEIGAAEGEFLRDGKIYPINGTRVVEKPEVETSKVPTLTSLSLNSNGELKPKPEVEVKVVAAPTPPAPVAPTPPQRLTGIWTLSPASLVDKSIEELNAMILERDATIQPFEDKNEAIAQLSMDVPPAK